jgi:peptidoglycan-associated lipoprotein
MKKHFTMIMVLITMIGFALVVSGCAKKVVVKEEAQMAQEAAVEKETVPEVKLPETKSDNALQEQMEREKAAAAAAAKAAKEASEFVDIYFDFDRSDLRPEARETLNLHAAWLKEHPDYLVRIEGNCDERGTVEYNMALGEKRAASAMTYLANLGVANCRITTISYGKERPLDAGHNEEAWAKNRRDHFVVTVKK